MRSRPYRHQEQISGRDFGGLGPEALVCVAVLRNGCIVNVFEDDPNELMTTDC